MAYESGERRQHDDEQTGGHGLAHRETAQHDQRGYNQKTTAHADHTCEHTHAESDE